MSKKKSRGNRRGGAPGKASLGKGRTVAAIALALMFFLGAGLLAQVRSSRKNKRASGDVSTMSLSGPAAKEYIWAGAKLIASVEPTAVNGNDAQFVSMRVKGSDDVWVLNGMGGLAFNMPGKSYLVEVTMLNTGATTWTQAGGYKLGSQNPPNNTTWVVSGQDLTNVPQGVQVAPGQQFTFTFGATKPQPNGGGYLNFQWQMMMQDPGVGFFGEKTTNGVIFSGAWLPENAPNAATFVSQSVPSSMAAGQVYAVSVTMNNAGTTWTAAANYNLGSQLVQNNTYWGANRVALPASVAPGANVTFNFNVTAPSTPGTYNFQWMMVQDGGVGWFGTLTQGVAVSVVPGCGNPPAVPLNLSATAQSSTSVLVSWNSSAGADHYEVQRRQNISSQWVTLSPNPTANSFLDNGLTPNTCYLYQVRAVDATGNCASAYSNVDLATTIIFTEDPLQSRNTIIRAQHVIEVRRAVDAVRTTANIGAAGWTNPLNYLDPVRPVDFSELRTRLNEALSPLGFSPIPSDPGIAQGLTIYATHLQAVRDKVK